MEFPGNSHREKQSEITEAPESRESNRDDSVEARAEQKVFDGDVVRRKKTMTRRVLDLVVNVAKELGEDVLIPALKDGAHDFLRAGLSRAFDKDADTRYERNRHSSTSSRVGTSVHTDYNRASRGDRDRRDSRGGRYDKTPINLDEVILKSRVQAEAVIDEMYFVLKKYDVVTVADLNHILGQDEATGYPDNNRGWFDLSGLRYRHISDGYLLIFPRVEDVR
jgi:hypothetical protein